MKPMLRHLKNTSGQATTAAMLLLPLVAVILTTLVLFGFAFVFEANATANCRASLNESQSEAREALEKLLALNPKAQRLENARQNAIQQVQMALATGDAAVYAAARMELLAIESSQIPVLTSQLRWLAKGRSASMAAPERAETSIRAGLPRAILQTSLSTPTLRPARFDVISSGPPGVRTPTYRTAPGFEQSQTAKVQWLLDLPKTSNGKELSPAIHIGCAMTLRKRGDEKWSPQILEDKLLQN
jgi:hypothetical protein